MAPSGRSIQTMKRHSLIRRGVSPYHTRIQTCLPLLSSGNPPLSLLPPSRASPSLPRLRSVPSCFSRPRSHPLTLSVLSITQPPPPYSQHPVQLEASLMSQTPPYSNESQLGFPPHSSRQMRPTTVATQAYPRQANEIIHTDDASTKLSDRVRRKCYNCHTTDTSTWRRSSLTPGKVVCASF